MDITTTIKPVISGAIVGAIAVDTSAPTWYWDGAYSNYYEDVQNWWSKSDSTGDHPSEAPWTTPDSASWILKPATNALSNPEIQSGTTIAKHSGTEFDITGRSTIPISYNNGFIYRNKFPEIEVNRSVIIDYYGLGVNISGENDELGTIYGDAHFTGYQCANNGVVTGDAWFDGEGSVNNEYGVVNENCYLVGTSSICYGTVGYSCYVIGTQTTVDPSGLFGCLFIDGAYCISLGSMSPSGLEVGEDSSNWTNYGTITVSGLTTINIYGDNHTNYGYITAFTVNIYGDHFTLGSSGNGYYIYGVYQTNIYGDYFISNDYQTNPIYVMGFAALFNYGLPEGATLYVQGANCTLGDETYCNVYTTPTYYATFSGESYVQSPYQVYVE